MQFNTILVVCAGNICRSPMAAGLLQKTWPRKKIHSAGLVALVGQPADPLAVACMQELDVSLQAHVARQLDQALLREADLVLAMSVEQVQAIERHWPFAKGKVFRLGHWSQQDVPDPYRQPRAAFVLARDLIVQAASEWEARLL